MSDRLATLMEYLEESPGDAFLLFAIAQEHLRKEDDVEAKRYFLQLKQEHPEYVGLYYHLGLLELKHGDALSARNTFREGMDIALKAGDQHAWVELNRALLESGEDEI